MLGHNVADDNLLQNGVVSMGRRNTQLRPTFIENKSLTATYGAASLNVVVTTGVTKLFGHKELSLSTGGAPVQSGGSPVTLPIDVLKQ
jgi:hypothetical protein